MFQFYTCGSRSLSDGIKKVCVDLMKHASPGIAEEAALATLEKIQKERFASDIFD